MPRFGSNSRSLHRVTLAGLAAASMLTACNRSDPVAAAINDARVELRKLNPNGGPGPVAEVRTDFYTTALTRLRAADSSATKAQQAAIALLSAEAESGLAQIALDEAFDQERQVLANLQRARALFAQWQDHKIREHTSRLYDPTEEIAEIDKAITERDAQIEDAEAARDDITKHVEDLQMEVDSRLAQARQERVVESDLRERSRSTSAVEGAELIQGAREHQRIADALEVEAENIQVKIDQARRQVDEAQLEVDRLRAQRELLGKARTDVQQRAEASAEQAAQAAQDADASAKRLVDMLATIEQSRSDSADLTTAYGAAFDALSRALAAANKAQTTDAARNNARAVVATVQQSIGDAHSARARGHAAYTAFLQMLVDEGQDLPGSAANSAALADAQAATQAERDDAAEAYGAARQAFSSIRVQGDEARQRIEQLDALLGGLTPQPEGN